jgi:hypothetical protein
LTNSRCCRRVGQHGYLRAEGAADLDGLDGHAIDDAVLGAGPVDHQQGLAGRRPARSNMSAGAATPALPMKEKR